MTSPASQKQACDAHRMPKREPSLTGCQKEEWPSLTQWHSLTQHGVSALHAAPHPHPRYLPGPHTTRRERLASELARQGVPPPVCCPGHKCRAYPCGPSYGRTGQRDAAIISSLSGASWTAQNPKSAGSGPAAFVCVCTQCLCAELHGTNRWPAMRPWKMQWRAST